LVEEPLVNIRRGRYRHRSRLRGRPRRRSRVESVNSTPLWGWGFHCVPFPTQWCMGGRRNGNIPVAERHDILCTRCVKVLLEDCTSTAVGPGTHHHNLFYITNIITTRNFQPRIHPLYSRNTEQKLFKSEKRRRVHPNTPSRAHPSKAPSCFYSTIHLANTRAVPVGARRYEFCSVFM